MRLLGISEWLFLCIALWTGRVIATDSPTLAPTDYKEPPGCNMTAYKHWYFSEYDSGSSLFSLKNFWGLGSQRWDTITLEITNGVAMEKAADICRLTLVQVKLDMAGRLGPVKHEYINEAMCSDACVSSDALHEEAMTASNCLCMELSTPDNSPLYHIEGDWCRRNSARLMCDIFDMCGRWECSLEDFMCPRYEYNTLYDRILERYGSCSGAMGLKANVLWTLGVLATSTVLAVHAAGLQSQGFWFSS